MLPLNQKQTMNTIAHRLPYLILAVGLAGFVSTAALSAGELKSGVEVGGAITAYETTKGGGIDDGVKAGQTLCYT